MDTGQALLFLRELLARLYRAPLAPGDHALVDHGRVALGVVFTALGLPAPDQATMDAYQAYADSLWQKHMPKGAARPEPLESRPNSNQTPTTPYVDFIAKAEEILVKCEQLKKSAENVDDTNYAEGMLKTATSMRQFMQTRRFVSVKMEAALTNMLDGITYRLTPQAEVTVQAEDESDQIPY